MGDSWTPVSLIHGSLDQRILRCWAMTFPMSGFNSVIFFFLGAHIHPWFYWFRLFLLVFLWLAITWVVICGTMSLADGLTSPVQDALWIVFSFLKSSIAQDSFTRPTLFHLSLAFDLCWSLISRSCVDHCGGGSPSASGQNWLTEEATVLRGWPHPPEREHTGHLSKLKNTLVE